LISIFLLLTVEHMSIIRDRIQEVIIVGTGPSGATAALELVRRGKKVLMIEAGKEHSLGLGIFHTYKDLYDKHLLFSRSKEGIIVDRALTLGGSSAVFNGNAFKPTKSFQKTLGMNLEGTVQETIDELKLAPFPETFMEGWNGTRRLVEAADSLGLNVVPQLKFIDPSRCNPKCDSCMSGCAINARWTARDYVRKAMAWPNGADLVLNTTVEEILVDKDTNKAIGVRISGNKNVPEKLYADMVILAAGGMGTPVILQKSGIEDAGKSFFMDPMDVTVGFTKDKGPWKGMTFTHACEDFEASDHFLLGNVNGHGAWLSQLIRGKTFFKNIIKYNKSRHHTMGMFTKIADESHGSIDINGRMSKPMSDNDLKNMKKGDDLCKKILIKAGCEPDSISVSTMIGGHPGGTAALDVVVDNNLETFKIKKLYVCDTSIFPRSPGSPPVLTLIAMVKKWARALDIT
ncbi:MAG: GMC family oxidoreductase, partial [Desulfoplanes sp.]